MIHLLIAFFIFMMSNAYWRRNEPDKTVEEIVEEAKTQGFILTVFGRHEGATITALVITTIYGVLVKRWWLGMAALALHVLVDCGIWFIITKKPPGERS